MDKQVTAETGSGAGRRTVRPTLKTIANISGFAVQTVSRALNDAPDIKEETKKTVRRIAREVGYVPDRAGVRLRTGRTNVISLMLATDHNLMSNTSRLISSIAETLRDTPYQMIVTPYSHSDDPLAPVRYVVETRSADAIILNEIQPRDPRVAFLMEHRFPFATHGRTVWSDQHPYFDYDNAAFGRITAAKMARRGRRNIITILPPACQSYSQQMKEGLYSRVQPSMRIREVEGVTSDDPADAIQEVLVDMFRSDPTIDAVLAGSQTAAMVAIAALEECGRLLGDGLDLYVKEAIPFLNIFRKDVDTVHEDVDLAGAFLARAIMQALRQPDAPPMQELQMPKDPNIDE